MRKMYFTICDLHNAGLSLLNTPEHAKAVATRLSLDTLKHSRNIRLAAIGNGVQSLQQCCLVPLSLATMLVAHSTPGQ